MRILRSFVLSNRSEQHIHIRAGFVELSRNDKTVPAVISAAAHDSYALAPHTVLFLDGARNSGTRKLHERKMRYSGIGGLVFKNSCLLII